jgi:hypothetical protein
LQGFPLGHLAESPAIEVPEEQVLLMVGVGVSDPCEIFEGPHIAGRHEEVEEPIIIVIEPLGAESRASANSG